MERKSLTERYERLESRRAELQATATAQPTAVHVQTVRVLGELLAMGEHFSTPGKVHPGLRTMMRMLRRLEPELVKDLAVVPPEAIREFLRDLTRRILTVVEVSEEEDARGNVAGAPVDQPGVDQSQTA